MTELLAALSGVLIAIMLAMNGGLSSAIGNAPATVFIHLTGLLTVGAWLGAGRLRLSGTLCRPWADYAGGLIGVGTVLFSNLAVGALGISLTLILNLVGQIAASLLVDGLGLLGACKRPFEKKKLVGLALVAAGAAAMLLL